MNLPATGRAAGKVILLGEHAVVYGRPGLATGLGLGLTAEVASGNGGGLRVDTDRPELGSDPRAAALIAEAATALGLVLPDLVVRIRSELPPGAGLGSSAALSVAVLRALAAAAGRRLTLAEELGLGRRLETIFHGHPSGIDPAAAVLGTCFRFVRGEPPAITPLRLGRPLPLVVALGARARSTGAAVGGLRERWAADRSRHERLFDEVASVVEAGTAAARDGDLEVLGEAFDRNQALLEALGVSAPDVEAVVASARRAGALGAKLTGGGAGGAVIALAREPEPLAARLEAEGMRTLVVRVSGATELAACA